MRETRDTKLLRLIISCVHPAQFLHVFTFPPLVKAETIFGLNYPGLRIEEFV